MINKNRASIKNEPPEPEVGAGLHNFEIVDLYEEIDAVTKFGVKDLLHIYCVVLDGDERGKVMKRRITRAFTAGFEGGSTSHLYDLASAVTKDILEDTEPFLITDLIGGVFRGKVMHKPDDRGRVWANIVKVAEAPAGAKKLYAGEKQFAMDLVSNLEEKRAIRKTEQGDSGSVGAGLPTKEEQAALKSEDAAINAGGEDVDPGDVEDKF